MATLEPITPKPGWALRWLRQGAVLCWRAKEMLMRTIATLFGLGALILGLDALLVSIGGARMIVLDSILYCVLVFTTMPVLVTLFAVFERADTGGRIYVHHLRTICVAIVPSVLLVLAFNLAITGLFMGMWSTQPSTDLVSSITSTATLNHPLLVTLDLGVRAIGLAMMFQAFLGVFTLPVAVCMPSDIATARAFSKRVPRKLPRIYNTIYWSLFAAGSVVILVGLYSLPLLFLYQAWLYVGAREVASGQRENGKARVTTTTAIPQPT